MSLRSRTVTIAMLLGLSGCDTLHGLRIELASDDKQSLPPACLMEGLRKAGLEMVPTGAAQAGIREIGGKGFLFLASYDPTRVNFYLLAMHEPLPCKDIQSIVPRMRSAANFTQEACSLPARKIIVSEKWSQVSCGL